MSYLLQAGDSFFPAPSKDALLDALPAGVFTLEEGQSGWFFKRTEGFQSLPKLYGSMERWQQRVITSFEQRAGNTGVLLSGEKGSGKSLLGRLISAAAAEKGMPTLLVNKCIPGAILGELLGQLSTPAVVFMDEFEKVFNEVEAQEEILGLLDGIHRSRHLFVLTVNDTHRMNKHLKNRPGRLYYHIEFQGLEAAFVEEYCAEHLKNQEWVADVKRVAALFAAFNFDMLQALVEEVNRFDEPPLVAVRLLNISPAGLDEKYKVEAYAPTGEKISLYESSFFGNPLNLKQYRLEFMVDDEKDDAALAPWEREMLAADRQKMAISQMVISQTDLAECKVEDGVYNFVKEGYRVVFTRGPRAKGSHWTDAF